jgi:Kef-type K+ transport system membrane component KefB
MMIMIIVFGMFGGTFFGILPQQSLFVAACLSLSSTPLIVKFLGNKHGEQCSKGNKTMKCSWSRKEESK